MHILCTGSAGYVGSVLVPKLHAAGHTVDKRDLGWFGGAPEKSDFRFVTWTGAYDAIIHLAAVANDPTGELNTELTWRTNALGTMRLAEIAAESGTRFIYASSGSVYGVSDLPDVTEDAACVPLTAYNETKKVAERCLLSYADRMAVQIVRPATVCGMSPRMRLDVMVNTLTFDALSTGIIKVWGGEHMRPHIHISDMCDLYLWLLARPERTGIWNAGFENLSVMTLAKFIAEKTGARIDVLPANDPRSYRMNSDKLLNAGFKPAHGVADAIDGMITAYASGELRDRPEWHSVEHMRILGLAA